jgi:murein DD-endopeptidase MepM/ murein hydrolase activator NlpD
MPPPRSTVEHDRPCPAAHFRTGTLVKLLAVALVGSMVIAAPAHAAAASAESVVLGADAALPPSADTVRPSRWLSPVGPAAGIPVVLRGFRIGPYPWSPGHRGVDLASATGEPVRAPASATVVYSGVIAGVGILSLLHADGVRTTYQPVAGLVELGQHVAAGTVVARVRGRGSHCAPRSCLHWGAIVDGAYRDPMQRLLSAPRLLPLHGSGSWVSLLIDRLQPLGGDVRVDLRSRE